MMSISISAWSREFSGLRSLTRGFAFRRTGSPRIRRTVDDLHQIEIADGVFLEALQHRLKHLKRLFLIFNQRIVLAVSTETNTLFQVVHAEQVVFPLRVEDAEHDHALVMAHSFGA